MLACRLGRRFMSTSRLSGQEIAVQVPSNVTVRKTAEQLEFVGPLGVSKLNLPKIDSEGVGAIKLSPEKEGTTISVISPKKSFLGTIRSLLNNKVEGVTRGFLIYLRIVGVGYRASLSDQTLRFKLGFSHDVLFTLPPSIKAFMSEPTQICLYGIDKNQVTQVAANIRRIKPPDPYKGKGIRFLDEVVKVKPGKKK